MLQQTLQHGLGLKLHPQLYPRQQDTEPKTYTPPIRSDSNKRQRRNSGRNGPQIASQYHLLNRAALVGTLYLYSLHSSSSVPPSFSHQSSPTSHFSFSVWLEKSFPALEDINILFNGLTPPQGYSRPHISKYILHLLRRRPQIVQQFQVSTSCLCEEVQSPTFRCLSLESAL